MEIKREIKNKINKPPKHAYASRGIRRKKYIYIKKRNPGNMHTRVPGVQKKRFLLVVDVEPLSGRKKYIYIRKKEKETPETRVRVSRGCKKDVVELLSVVVVVVAMTWHCRCGVVAVGV